MKTTKDLHVHNKQLVLPLPSPPPNPNHPDQVEIFLNILTI